MIKIAFFDIDNTLYDWETLRFVPSGIQAVKDLSKKGVKVVLCSARPYASIKEFGVFDLGIHWNGVISNCGAFVAYGNRTLRKLVMEPSVVRKLCRIATSHSLTMELVTAKTRFLIAEGNTFLENYHGTYSDNVPPVHRYRGEGVTGVLLFCPEEYDPYFHEALPNLTYYRFHPFGVDISEYPHLKGDGIGMILDALGIRKEEALSFGDDLQDISMGERTIFTCVGNGHEKAKAAADYVCPPIAEDGLLHALRHWEVLP